MVALGWLTQYIQPRIWPFNQYLKMKHTKFDKMHTVDFTNLFGFAVKLNHIALLKTQARIINY